jgi:hypothetical protein
LHIGDFELSDKKPTLADLGLDAPIGPPKLKKSWEEIANEVDDSPAIRCTCPHCGSVVPSAATKCASCQEWISKPPGKWSGIAAVMSFFIPGLGQLYKGEVAKSILFFIGMLVLWGITSVFWPFLLFVIIAWIFITIEAGLPSK